jgi:hypothetical protein
MFRARTTTPTALPGPFLVSSLGLLLALLVGLAGCGSQDAKSPGKSADEPAGTATASQEEKPDADGMVTMAKGGVSLKVPATWKLDKDTMDDELFIWVNPKSKGSGLVALGVRNSTETAEEWIAMQEGPNGILRGQVKKRTPVEVEGLGKGYRLHTEYQQNITDRLVVATIDGLLVEVIYVPDPDPEHSDYADIILSSVARDL